MTKDDLIEIARIQLNLLQRINEVRKAVSYIQKDKSVSTGAGSYKAVTHDTVTATLRPAMIEHGIVMFPYLVESQSMPFEVNADGVKAKQFRYEATYDFTFANIDSPDDALMIRIQAHAMDNADKAPGKALSYAAKYAMLKVFNLETGESEESRFNPEGLSDDVLSMMLDSINSASNMADLKMVFAAGFKAADEAGDKEACKIIIRAKDARKLTIQETIK